MPAKPTDSDQSIRIIIGLGNPGREYDGTRHNVGFEIVERLAQSVNAEWRREKKWQAEVARYGQLVLVKPQTFMNLSGRTAAAVSGFYKIPATAMLVVYDDADLALGQLRFRASGSAGGHNGIKSLIQCLGSDQFPRLKFGIGQKPVEGQAKRAMIGHVLGRFSAEEQEVLEKSLANAVDAVNCALARGLMAAMNEFNTKSKPTKPKAKPSNPPEAPQTTENPSNPIPSSDEIQMESGPDPES